MNQPSEREITERHRAMRPTKEQAEAVKVLATTLTVEELQLVLDYCWSAGGNDLPCFFAYVASEANRPLVQLKRHIDEWREASELTPKGPTP